MIHVEYDKLNCFFIYNNNVYTGVEDNCGDVSCTVIPDVREFCDAGVSDKKCF